MTELRAKVILAIILDFLGVMWLGPNRTRCLDCGMILLSGFNWTAGCRRKSFHICRDCNTQRKREWRGR